MTKARLNYADFCKLFAMFIVTWEHCSQCISGDTFPYMFGRQGISIAFNMPLFMIVSGMFIDPRKIVGVPICSYLLNKFQRLVVPAVVWYFLCCILTVHMPHIERIFSYYWFLSSMFVSYALILLICKLTKGNPVGIFLSILIVILIPYSSILKVNFMYPMMWGG